VQDSSRQDILSAYGKQDGDGYDYQAKIFLYIKDTLPLNTLKVKGFT
jgi:hypothetical protein